jgi:putative transposase
MPRRKRNYLARLPYHIVQRGNNRQPCFYHPQDYALYLDLWREKSRWYGVDVHAVCLMTNHIHFIVTGHESDAISNTMKVVGSRYAQSMNRRYQRTGTLWEGRHRPSLIDSARYLLTCYRYVELNPVRANMVSQPGDYAWSSYDFNANEGAGWLQPHDVYLALGSDRRSRANAYRALFASPLSEEDIETVRQASHYCQPVGDDAFIERIAIQFGSPRGYCARGRPPKKRK